MFPDTKTGYSIEIETTHLLQHTLHLRLTPLITVLFEKLIVDQPFTTISLPFMQSQVSQEPILVRVLSCLNLILILTRGLFN